MKFKLATVALVAAFTTGCAGTLPSTVDSIVDVASEVVAPSGADADYTAYLRYCNAQVANKVKASSTGISSIANSLAQSTDPATRGALTVIAAYESAKPVDLNCTLDRKIGFIEGIGSNGLIGIGLELYKENRANIRFKKKLEFDAKALETNSFYSNEARKDTNQLWRDLIGTPKERSDAAIILAP